MDRRAVPGSGPLDGWDARFSFGPPVRVGWAEFSPTLSLSIIVHNEMTEPASTHDPSSESPETGADRIVGAAATLAQHLIRAVGVLALTATLAGGTLWTVVWWPVPLDPGPLVAASLTLIALLAPAAVLGLFYAGLQDLVALPDRLSVHTSRTVEASTGTYHAATDSSVSWWDRLRRLLKRIWSLRSLLAEHRALLVRYGAVLRLVTPGFLLLVVVAAGAAILLVPGTVLVLLGAWVL